LKKGFSLIELMIVIMIIGVVYTLAITKLKVYSNTQGKAPLTLKTLKPYLYQLANKAQAQAKLVCFDGCEVCRIYVGGEKAQELSNPLVTTQVVAYKYDYFDGMTPYTPTPIFDENGVEHDVCFELRVDTQNIATQIIVEDAQKVYDYSDYFQDVVVYNSLEEAKQAKEKQVEEVR
jgi:prepilin-type N-terminal cleavage/methylation domain-containing protein